jgi:hypothetical protein
MFRHAEAIMNRCLILPIVCILCIAFPACSEEDEGITPDDPSTPSGKLTSASECKTFTGPALEAAMSATESCIEYSYDPAKQVLDLKHVNAGFNCCPGELSADISVEKNIITISEREREALCNCNCLYDLTIEIRNLMPGMYTIHMVEPYRHDADPELSFQVDLNAVPEGKSCVPRSYYPWGM